MLTFCKTAKLRWKRRRGKILASLLAALLLLSTVGTLPTRASPTSRYRHHQIIWVTGYLWTGYRAYDGTWPHWGTGGSDLYTIPLHTMVNIDGVGKIWINDTGSAVRPYQVDVYCPSLSTAYRITGYRMASW